MVTKYLRYKGQALLSVIIAQGSQENLEEFILKNIVNGAADKAYEIIGEEDLTEAEKDYIALFNKKKEN